MDAFKRPASPTVQFDQSWRRLERDILTQKDELLDGFRAAARSNGMEDEGRIGTELTYEGSKPIERLDFALFTTVAQRGGNDAEPITDKDDLARLPDHAGPHPPDDLGEPGPATCKWPPCGCHAAGCGRMWPDGAGWGRHLAGRRRHEARSDRNV